MTVASGSPSRSLAGWDWMVAALLKLGADPNGRQGMPAAVATGSLPVTPLHLAMSLGHPGVAGLLEAAGRTWKPATRRAKLCSTQPAGRGSPESW